MNATVTVRRTDPAADFAPRDKPVQVAIRAGNRTDLIFLTMNEAEQLHAQLSRFLVFPTQAA